MSSVRLKSVLLIAMALLIAAIVAKFSLSMNLLLERDGVQASEIKLAAMSSLLAETDTEEAPQILVRTDWRPQTLPITKGWTPKTLWVKLEVENTSSQAQDVWIEVAPARLTWIRMHEPLADGAWRQHTSGVSIAANDRPIQLSDIVYPLSLKANEKRTVLLEARSNTTELDLTLKLHAPLQFVEMSTRRNLVELMIIGGTLTLGLISLIAGLALRQALQLLLGLRSLLIGVWLLGQLGVLTLFLSASHVAILAGSVRWAAVLTFFFTLAFIWLFLSRVAGTRLPRFVHGVFAALAVTGCISTAAMVVGLISPHQLSLPFGLLTLILLLFTVPLSAWLIWRGSSSAITILVTSAISLLINLPAYLSLVGSSGKEVIRHFISPIPVLIATAVFFVGTAIQLSRERRERDTAEQEIQKRAMAQLEDLVSERTQDLKTARDEAQLANAAKTVFMAKVGHELRTPMHSLLGYVNLALREKLAEPVERKLRVARRAGEQLVAQIGDLLDYVRMGRDQIRLVPVAFELQALLESASERARLLECQGGNRFVSQLDAQLPIAVVGDDGRIEQVLMVLLTNAMRYTKDGVITLDVKLVFMPELGDHTHCALRFTVRDTGRGISPEALKNLFIAFDRGASTDADGLGLGLPIAQQLLGLMGSQLEVSSTLGAGSSFAFNVVLGLPSTEQLAQLSVQTSGQKQGSGLGKRVLLLEDDPASLQYLQELLSHSGYEVVAVDHLAAALEAIKPHAMQASFNLVITDQHLGQGQTGWGLVSALLLAGNTAPVLMLSATDPQPPADASPQLLAGVAQHVLKPVSDAQLLATLSQLLPPQAAPQVVAQAVSQESSAQSTAEIDPQAWAQLQHIAQSNLVTGLITWRKTHAYSANEHAELWLMFDALRFSAIADYAGTRCSDGRS